VSITPADILLTERVAVVTGCDHRQQWHCDGRLHGLVPMVRTPKGTFVSGAGLLGIAFDPTDGVMTVCTDDVIYRVGL